MDMNQQTESLTNSVGFAHRMTHLNGYESMTMRPDVRLTPPLDITIPEALKTPIEALSRGIAAQVQVMNVEELGPRDPRTKTIKNREDELKTFRAR